MPRQNACGVIENSEFKVDKEKYNKNYTSIFGEKPSPFCNKCDKRWSFCECEGCEEEPKKE